MGNLITGLFKVLWVMVLISLALSLVSVVCADEKTSTERLREQRQLEEVNRFPIRGYDRNIPEPRRIKGYDPESYQQAPYPVPYKGKTY